MILVTGGAGFIGSNLCGALSRLGIEVTVADWLGQDERWRNIARCELADIVPPQDLMAWLARRSDIEIVFHMGANSSTTDTNIDSYVQNNIRATLALWEWCAATGTRFIYASSAATYGAGEMGFDDVQSRVALARLRPLNAYGWSKHVVDRRIARLVESRSPAPPQWAGLKFFNVYGPNEYHKGDMRSVAAKNFDAIQAGKPIRLFKSASRDFADGGQLRDFIYVRDCVDVMLWLMRNPGVSGLFNLGSGKARSWRDLAAAMFSALDRALEIDFFEMPPHMLAKYQYFTEATMTKLRDAGYDKAFTGLEDGIADYMRCLSSADPYC
jgi:ADP-L-glycero-D-manno-heptose 6-epimerase